MSNDLRGLVLPLNITADDSATTAVSDGRHTGRAVATSVDGAMGLRSRRRDREASTYDEDPGIIIRTQRGGLPSPADTASPATFLWRYDDETDAEFRGWENPWTVQRYRTVVFESVPVSDVDAIRWDDGKAIAYQTLQSGDYEINVSFIDRDATETRTNVVEASTTRVAHPCLVVVRGRLHVYWWEQHASSLYATLDTAWSIAGAVWDADASAWESLGFVTRGDDALPHDDVTVSHPDQIRAACVDDTVVIVGNYRTPTALAYRVDDTQFVVQYRSSDGGHSFTYRGIQSTDSSGGADTGPAAQRLDIVAHQRSFLVAYADLVEDDYRVVRLGRTQDLSEAWQDGTPVGLDPDPSVSVGSGGTAHIGLTVGEDGLVYVYAVDSLVRSTDGGETWEPPFLLQADTGTIEWPSLVPIDGSLHLVGGIESSNAPSDEFIVAQYELGGPSNAAPIFDTDHSFNRAIPGLGPLSFRRIDPAA